MEQASKKSETYPESFEDDDKEDDERDCGWEGCKICNSYLRRSNNGTSQQEK